MTIRPAATTSRRSRRSRCWTRPAPAFVGGLFQLAYGTLCDAGTIVEVARTGDGMGWGGEHNSDVHDGCERFFFPTYAANVVDSWIPALDGWWTS